VQLYKKNFRSPYTGSSCQIRIGSPKMARKEQVCAHQKSYSKQSKFSKIFMRLLCTRGTSCAPILRFFSTASDGTTAEHEIHNCVFLSI